MLAETWPKAEPLIREAMRRGGGISNFASVAQSVQEQRALLWVACDRDGSLFAAAVTRFIEPEGRKVCDIIACGGLERTRWIPLIRPIEEFARAEKCTAMQITGRKGWARVLGDYKVRFFVLEKEL